MATLSVQTIANTSNGLAVSYASASTSDNFANDGNTFLHIKNSGTQKTLTLVTQATSVQKAGHGTISLANQTFTITATTGDQMIGPFPPSRWNDANGRVNYTLDSATGVTVAAVKLPLAV